jgi:drug/metabolite transporter (DMT)-like permease
MSDMMMSAAAQPVAILLAFAAAVSWALANVLQQRIAARLPSASAFDPAVLLRLIRRPLWLAGMVLVIAAFALQATALGTGRLVVIEPVLASSLLVALVLAARADKHRMRPGEWAASFATFAGLAGFLVTSQSSGGEPIAGTEPLGLAVAMATGVAVVCGGLAGRLPGPSRALLLGVGGGIAAGVTDALTKSVAALAGTRALSIFADARFYLLVWVGLLTFVVQQNGYRAARLAGFLPMFSVLEPVVGAIAGLLIYHERLDGGSARIVVEAVASVAAIWGIVRLAGSSAALAAERELAPVEVRAEP